MTNKFVISHAASPVPVAGAADRPDEEVMQALVTAGAMVAIADGRLEQVERNELVDFIDRRGFVPAFSPNETAKAFDDRVRQLKDRNSPNVILEALRPLAGRSLSSILIRTAERVAAADQKIHPAELRAIKLIRLIMRSLPADKVRGTFARSPIGPASPSAAQRP
jgi:tellurite resistance protein TerB